jgi:glutamate-1-semialdehyde 2,1-aminomutase
MIRKQSDELFRKAQACIPGGVNSPVRACKSVDSDPLFIDRAEGCMLYDADGNAYIDYIGSWGPMILGHRHPAVIQAIQNVLERGTSYGAPTDLEVELATMVVEAVPSVEMVRMVNSGTEATMSAVRLARGFTDRELIVKFDGCYHGHADSLLVEAGSGVATLGIPGSPGVPVAFAERTLSLPFNDIEAVRKAMQEKGQDIAAVIIEPVVGNMGLVPPVDGFLEALREETLKAGSLLIFDEVMTGFRVAYGGAQTLYNITPDISCFGKIIGGGMPVGAYGGRSDIMAHIAPQGPVYQAGTLSGNPVAMAAGIATLKELKHPGFYDALDTASERLLKGFNQAAETGGQRVSVNRVGSMVGMFFTSGSVRNFSEAKASDLKKFTDYYRGMLKRGIYLAPSQFEALFVSAAHTTDKIDATIAAAEEVMRELGQ